VRGTAVFLTEDAEGAPLVLLHHLKHNQVLHESVVLLTLVTEERPYVPDAERVQVQQLSAGFWRVIGRSGFMEEPDAPRVLLQAAAQVEGLEVAPLRTTYYLGRQTVVPRESSDPNHVARVRIALFRFLRRNERSASMYFEIPPNRVVELGARVEI
jgi:KUP system potassium uptake protein